MSIAFRVGFLAAIVFVLSNCATKPTEIEPQYVSHLQYTDFDCDQISEELQRISVRSDLLFHRLDKTASTDETQMAVGMILFWPMLFWLEGGDGPEAAEYAHLKGEVNALEKVAIDKQCDMTAFETIRAHEAMMLEEKKKRQQRDCDPSDPYSYGKSPCPE